VSTLLFFTFPFSRCYLEGCIPLRLLISFLEKKQLQSSCPPSTLENGYVVGRRDQSKKRRGGLVHPLVSWGNGYRRIFLLSVSCHFLFPPSNFCVLITSRTLANRNPPFVVVTRIPVPFHSSARISGWSLSFSCPPHPHQAHTLDFLPLNIFRGIQKLSNNNVGYER